MHEAGGCAWMMWHGIYESMNVRRNWLPIKHWHGFHHYFHDYKKEIYGVRKLSSMFFEPRWPLWPVSCVKFHPVIPLFCKWIVQHGIEARKPWHRPSDVIDATDLAIITVKYHLCVGIWIDIAWRLFFFLSAWWWCITGILVFLLRLHSVLSTRVAHKY